MSSLFLPIAPKNYRNDWGSTDITGDIFRICEQVADLSPNLIIRERPDWETAGGYRYIVSEISADGVERWVLGVNELDGRLTERLQRMLFVPFEERFAAAEREEQRYKAAEVERELDELAENIGLPMQTQLERCGFTQRSVSYPKAGHVGGRGSKRRQ